MRDIENQKVVLRRRLHYSGSVFGGIERNGSKNEAKVLNINHRFSLLHAVYTALVNCWQLSNSAMRAESLVGRRTTPRGVAFLLVPWRILQASKQASGAQIKSSARMARRRDGGDWARPDGWFPRDEQCGAASERTSGHRCDNLTQAVSVAHCSVIIIINVTVNHRLLLLLCVCVCVWPAALTSLTASSHIMM